MILPLVNKSRDAIYRNNISLHLATVSLTDIGFLFVPLDDDWLNKQLLNIDTTSVSVFVLLSLCESILNHY